MQPADSLAECVVLLDQTAAAAQCMSLATAANHHGCLNPAGAGRLHATPPCRGSRRRIRLPEAAQTDGSVCHSFLTVLVDTRQKVYHFCWDRALEPT